MLSPEVLLKILGQLVSQAVFMANQLLQLRELITRSILLTCIAFNDLEMWRIVKCAGPSLRTCVACLPVRRVVMPAHCIAISASFSSCSAGQRAFRHSSHCTLQLPSS